MTNKIRIQIIFFFFLNRNAWQNIFNASFFTCTEIQFWIPVCLYLSIPIEYTSCGNASEKWIANEILASSNHINRIVSSLCTTIDHPVQFEMYIVRLYGFQYMAERCQLLLCMDYYSRCTSSNSKRSKHKLTHSQRENFCDQNEWNEMTQMLK